MTDELLGTRATTVYIILLVVSVIILAFYSSITVHIKSVTVSMPSVATFERLYELYPLTLICPCSQVAVPHNKMITFSQPRFHQVKTIVKNIATRHVTNFFPRKSRCFVTPKIEIYEKTGIL
jgi:hypothetical protein